MMTIRKIKTECETQRYREQGTITGMV